jgi:G:T-mismatch repair DNA endonuclease (very short patch repair protein)
LIYPLTAPNECGRTFNSVGDVNQVYWEGKIRRNQSRDGEINLQLEKLGWRVLRIWESSLQDEEAVAAKLSRVM